MKRLLTLAAVALLCAAGAELTSVSAVASNADRSVAAGRFAATLYGYPATTIPVRPSPDQAAAAKAKEAMQAVLPSAQIAFTIFDRQTDTVLASHNAEQQYASMSVVKLLIALDALARNNWATPDDAARQQLHHMLADSDDGIASHLWATNGGPAIVTRMVGLLGLGGTEPPRNPGQWGDTLITPQDLVAVYRYITDQLPGPLRNLTLGALAAAPRTATDGFDQYFGIPEGMPNTTWAIKQGWGTSGPQAVMSSTGVVGKGSRYVVVVLASASARSYSNVPAVVTAGAGALADLVGG